MMHRPAISPVLLTLLLLIGACSEGPSRNKEEKVSQDMVSLESEVGITTDLSQNLQASEAVMDVYSSQGFKPIWYDFKGNLTPRGEWLDSLLGRVEYLGLDRSLFLPTEGLDSWKKQDVGMTMNFTRLCSFMEHGVLDIDSLHKRMLWQGRSAQCLDWLELPSDQRNSKLIDLQPKYREFQDILQGLAGFLDHYPLTDSSFRIPDPKEDSVTAANLAKQMMIHHHFGDSIILTDDTAYIHALKDLQALHGLFRDGRLGKNTRKALQMSNLDRFRTACLALEKYRGQGEVPQRFVQVNIPEFVLRFYNQDTLVRMHRVVVGTPQNSTPEFHATLQRVITFPFWHVPWSIASKEITYSVAKDSTHLDRNGYEVFDRKGNKMDPNTIDWKKYRGNFPYRIRQKSGSSNSLGIIKFQFPNEHAVFIHDTPSKRLFKNESRAYSHGCIRLENPLDLAKAVFTLDSNMVGADTLDTIVMNKQQKVIELNRPFDVFISYITTGTDSTGQIRFFHDLYGRDEKFLQALFTD